MTIMQGLIEAENWLRTHIGYPPLAGARGGKKMAREFKKGDKVKVIAGDYHVTTVGTTWLVDDPNDGGKVIIHNGAGGMRFWLPREHLALVSAKTLEDLGVGDVVEKTKEEHSGPYTHTWSMNVNLAYYVTEVTGLGSKRTVLAILSPGVYALSKGGQQDSFGEIMTAKDLERKGYTVKGAQDEAVKMTVSDIAKKLGHEVEIIKENKS